MPQPREMTATNGGILVSGKVLSTLAGVSPQATSQAARRGALAPARTPNGAVFIDHPSTFQWLGTHPFHPEMEQSEIDRFLDPALAKLDPRRDEHGVPLLDPLHPNAVAYLARSGGCSFEAWALWAGDRCLDFSAPDRESVLTLALDVAAAHGADLVDSLVALVSPGADGAWTGTVCGRAAFIRTLTKASRHLAKQAEAELSHQDGRLPVYLSAPSESSLMWLAPEAK